MFSVTIKNSKPYIRSKCKQCRNEERLDRYKRNVVLYREISNKWHHNNPTRVLYRNAKDRAKNLSLPFNIEIEDIVIPERCPILDIPLIKSYGKLTGNSPSLDRVIPSLGYVKGNVRVISFRANRLKSDVTIAELKKILAYMENVSETPATED